MLIEDTDSSLTLDTKSKSFEMEPENMHFIHFLVNHMYTKVREVNSGKQM